MSEIEKSSQIQTEEIQQQENSENVLETSNETLNEINEINEIDETENEILHKLQHSIKEKFEQTLENSTIIITLKENSDNSEISNQSDESEPFSEYTEISFDEIDKIKNIDLDKYEVSVIHKNEDDDESEDFTRENENVNNQNSQNDENKEINKINEILSDDEKQTIQKWTQSTIQNVLFDSTVDNWKQSTSVFDKKIMGKENIIIVIEDSKQNVFGCYLSCQICRYYDYDEKLLNYHADPKSFIFTLRSNGRINGHEQFKILKENYSNTFALFKPDFHLLFRIGNDISVGKEGESEYTYCQKYSYDYNDKENVLTGKEGKDATFIVKRIVVYQLEELENVKEEKKQEKQERDAKNREKLTKRTNEIKNEINKERTELILSGIQQIEQWSQSRFEEVIFDSEIHDWSIGTSEFDKIIKDKETIAIQIDDTDGNIFGGYIQRKINQYVLEERGKDGDLMDDYHAFLFSLSSCGRYYRMHKCNILDKAYSFVLFSKHDQKLFSFGKDEITVVKKNSDNDSVIHCDQFNYNGKYDLFGNKDGSPRKFKVKRIQVYQMKQGKEQKDLIEEEIKLKNSEQYQQLEEENEKIKNILHVENTETETELKNIIETVSEMSFTSFETLLFDSDLCEWIIGRNKFNNCIIGHEHLVFLIEDTEKNIFGVYIDSRIQLKNIPDEEKKEHDLISVNGDHSFVFRIYPKGDEKKSKRFRIQPDKKSNAFKLYKSYYGRMFSVGNDDIVIMKKEEKTECSCRQFSFNYEEEKDALRGKHKNGKFEVERIRVLKMSQTEEQKTKRDNDEKSREEKLEQLFNEVTEKVFNEQNKRKDSIQNMLNLIFHKVVYDSECIKNKYNISIDSIQKILFNNTITQTQRFVLICEDDEGNVFGCCMKQPRNFKKMSTSEKYITRNRTFDKRISLFILDKHLSSQNTIHFPIKEEFKFVPIVYEEGENVFTMSVGKGDFVMIEINHKIVVQHINSHYFNYNEKEGLLKSINNIEVKRFQIWVMERNQDNNQNLNSSLLLNDDLNGEMESFGTSDYARTNNKSEIIKEGMTPISNSLLKSFFSNAIKLVKSSPKDDPQNEEKQYNQKLIKNINQIQQWTGKQFNRVVFASEFMKWKEGNSVFDRLIKDKQNLAILFEIDNGNFFGVYLSVPKDQICHEENRIDNCGIRDENAFIFTSVNENIKRYLLKEEERDKPICFVYERYCEKLIEIGRNDILIKKDGNKSLVKQNNDSSFNYKDEQNNEVSNALISVVGGDNGSFNVQRIWVFQFQ